MIRTLWFLMAGGIAGAWAEDPFKPGRYGRFELVEKVQVDQADLNKAKRLAEDVLQKHPDLDAMVGLWAYNAPRVLEALKDAGKDGKVKVFSFDEDPMTLKAIEQGRCEGTIVQNPYEFGRRAIRELVKLNGDLKGEEKKSPELVNVSPRMIDLTNVAIFAEESKQEELRARNQKGRKEGKKGKRYAFVTNVDAPFWVHAHAGCLAAERQFGVSVEFITNLNPTPAGQNTVLRKLANRKFDGVAVSVLDPTAQNAVLNQVAEKIPLITVDSDAPKSERKLFVGASNYEAGRMLGRLMKKRMPTGGTFTISVGMISHASGKDRVRGLLDELKAKK